jgi:hypothetical protein
MSSAIFRQLRARHWIPVRYRSSELPKLNDYRKIPLCSALELVLV